MSTESYQILNTIDPVKQLADPQRQAILRLLMRQDYTLSQLAELLKSYPAQVRHHLKILEAAGLVEMVATRQVRGFQEKYYRASAHAYLVQLPILPAIDPEQGLLTFCSHDLGLELLARLLPQSQPALNLTVVPVGSLDSLVALRQGVCQMAGCHLLDVESGIYNLPFIRHLFPGQPMRVVHMARRLQGLIVPPGNPLGIREFANIARPEVSFINRQPGSGTRVWLDHKLRTSGIPSSRVPGYSREARTHHQVAQAVASGEANTGIGLYAAALAYSVGFIPLFEEAYDLVLPVEVAESKLLAPMWDLINTAEFRMSVQILGGYYPRRMGEVTTI
ncbi:MAG: substrate-binding domain-containing protein [Anaerolineales bacterium]